MAYQLFYLVHLYTVVYGFWREYSVAVSHTKLQVYGWDVFGYTTISLHSFELFVDIYVF